ncbi:nuclear transport factor 2 family protein [Cytobacillus praedii]|uniref:steroid delta-isomerase n=1 Tax=Cytobacillus praedii TaxID=1742358 RepID=UPI0012F71C70|nr:steroid delta-isomerase [Cytobacillus praedii]
MMSLFADEARVEDPVGTPPKIGRKEVRKFYSKSLSGGNKLELLASSWGSYGKAAMITFPVHEQMEVGSLRIDVTDVMTFDSNSNIITMQAY